MYQTLESFGMLHGIPRTPTHLFLTELYRWQPAAQTGKYLETIWPEECPYDRRASTVPLSLRSLDDLTYAVTLLNKGVEFHERFFNQVCLHIVFCLVSFFRVCIDCKCCLIGSTMLVVSSSHRSSVVSSQTCSAARFAARQYGQDMYVFLMFARDVLIGHVLIDFSVVLSLTALRNAIIQAERDDAEMKKLIELQEVAVENRLTLARNVNKPFAYEIADLVRQLIRIYGEQQPHWTLKLDHLLPMSKVFLP
jgi:hypothetical protein